MEKKKRRIRKRGRVKKSRGMRKEGAKIVSGRDKGRREEGMGEF